MSNGTKSFLFMLANTGLYCGCFFGSQALGYPINWLQFMIVWLMAGFGMICIQESNELQRKADRERIAAATKL